MNDEAQLSLKSLLDKIPPELQPMAEKYGPTLIKMGQDEVTAWVARLLDGDYEGAYQTLLDRMDDTEVLEEGVRLAAEWRAANKSEAERREFFKNMGLDLLKVGFALLAAAVSL